MNFTATPRIARELDWPRALTLGNKGADVLRAQEWLSLRGFSTSIDGEFGPATNAAFSKFAAGLPATLETLASLCAPMRRAFAFECEAPSLRAAVAAVAQAHASQKPREIGGDNRGPWVRAYCGDDGSAFAWCAGAACSILAQACALRDQPAPFAYSLGCDELAAFASHAHRLTRDPATVRGGDLFLCFRGSPSAPDYYHTGIVTAMHADHMETIEGNTNDDGSANGYELIPRTRSLTGKHFALLN
jgi:hypothetical protein